MNAIRIRMIPRTLIQVNSTVDLANACPYISGQQTCGITRKEKIYRFVFSDIEGFKIDDRLSIRCYV